MSDYNAEGMPGFSREETMRMQAASQYCLVGEDLDEYLATQRVTTEEAQEQPEHIGDE